MSHRRVELRRVLPKEAVTCAQGLAALTPTAEGSPTPIVPDGPEFTPWPGTGRDRLTAQFKFLLPLDNEDRGMTPTLVGVASSAAKRRPER